MLSRDNSKKSCFNVIDDDWDVLIIYDATRYDYFYSLHKYFFEGSLTYIYSCGSSTHEWFYNTFKNRYVKDLIYISSNPVISSIGVITGYLRNYRIIKFKPSNHIYKIIDVWYSKWDPSLGTVHPLNTSIEALNELIKYNLGNKRFIIHYIQPHAPYITCHKIINKYNNDISINNKQNSIFIYLYNLLNLPGFLLLDLNIGDPLINKLYRTLGVPSVALLEEYKRVLGLEGLRRCYMQNLYMVMYYSAPLIDILASNKLKVVVSADHGEALGERGSLGHWGGSKLDVLRKVPYLNVKRVIRKPRVSRFELALKIKASIRGGK